MLFEDIGAPLLAVIFLSEIKAVLLVKFARRIEALDRPQVSFLKFLLIAKPERLRQQGLADSATANTLVDDKPKPVALILQCEYRYTVCGLDFRILPLRI